MFGLQSLGRIYEKKRIEYTAAKTNRLEYYLQGRVFKTLDHSYGYTLVEFYNNGIISYKLLYFDAEIAYTAIENRGKKMFKFFVKAKKMELEQYNFESKLLSRI